MAIYTRTGDKGNTSLFNGSRVLKSHIRVEAYGTIDELNSLLGVVIAKNKIAKIQSKLVTIQSDLLELGSALAHPDGETQKLSSYLGKRVEEFEKTIDDMTQEMPVLSNFILPGGGEVGSLIHLSRTVARRVERRMVELMQKEVLDKGLIKYVNRLSDLLFTMARFVNYKEKQKEFIWNKK